MESSHSCCSFTVPTPPIKSDEELPDVAAYLCPQCTSIDLDALMHEETKGAWYGGIFLKINMSSPCPLCQFFIATVASNKTLFTNPNHELEFKLEALDPRRACSNYFRDVLKSWYDSSMPSPMSKSQVLSLEMAVPCDSLKNGMGFERCATLGSPLNDEKPVFSLQRLERGRIDFSLVKGWLSYCKAHHIEMCGILKGYPRQLSCLKVIECETGAIMKLPEGCELAALSYV